MLKKMGLIPEALFGFAGALLLTVATYTLSIQAGWIDNWNSINQFELWGVVFNYACVWLVARKNIVNWPLGLIAVVLLGILFWQSSLYSSMALSLIYFLPIQFYGWYNWLYGGENKTELPVSTLSYNGWALMVGLSLPAFYGISELNAYFGGALPLLDTLILTASVMAQQLLSEKKIENWVMWFIVNVASIYVYATSGLYVLALQYTFFLLNAIYGFVTWLPATKQRIV